MGYPLLARIALSAYSAAASTFIVAMGFSLADYAFAFMLALHSVSALLSFRRFIPVEAFRQRLVTAAGILTVMILCYYGAQTSIAKVITPLRYDGKVYVLNRLVKVETMKRGERVAYRIGATDRHFSSAAAHGTVIVQAGFGFGNILATEGDEIKFTPEALLVNGIRFPRQSRMPVTGDLIVPQNHWFIWPDFAINIQGDAAQIQADEMLLRMGMVDKSDFAGKVFSRWFWRKQL